MRVQLVRCSLLGCLALLAAGCTGHQVTSSPPTTPPPPTAPTGSAAPTAPPAPTAPLAHCATPGLAAPPGCWDEILPLGSGGFPAAPGSQDRPLWEPGKFPVTLPPRLAFGDELWMIGQTLAYSSPDGLTWDELVKTDWGERIYHSVVYFHGKLWMYGGLDYQARTFLNDIWSSSDGSTWQKVGTAAWPARGSQTMAVFRDQLWLFGGADHVASDRSTDGFLHDVWVSDDGLTWTEVTGAAPWSARESPGVVVFDDELYLVGGQGQADVWRSSNGADWTPVTADPGWPPRYGSASAVFDGRLWVFGGWIGQPTNALNDVWYSSDGVTWNRQAEHAPWTPRSPLAVVFQDKIWIYSGKHTGAPDNWGGDLWQMVASASEQP